MPKKVIDDKTLDMIRMGESLNKIRNKTGIAKSTIYYHYKKIIGKRINPIKFNFKKKEELGEFLGIFAGDGSFYKSKKYHYSVKVYTGYYEKMYLKHLEKSFVNWFDKKPGMYYSKHNGNISSVMFVYNSKQLYLLIKKHLDWKGKKTYTIALKNLDLNNKSFNIGFIRGLIDTDGNYYAPKRRLSFSTVSKNLAYQYVEIVKSNLGLDPNINITSNTKSNRATIYTITLHGKNTQKALKIIKPNNPNKTCSSSITVSI